jgi:hypothetical protein
MATTAITAAPTLVDGSTAATTASPTALAGAAYAAADTVTVAATALAPGANGKILFSFNVTTAGTLTLKAPTVAAAGLGSAGPYHRRAGADQTITFGGTGRFILTVELGKWADAAGLITLVSGTAAGSVQILKMPPA